MIFNRADGVATLCAASRVRRQRHAREARAWHRLFWAPLTLVALTGCGTPAGPKVELRPPLVTVASPTEIETVDTYFYDGYTAAVSTVDERARVNGYLEKVYFKDGDDVKEGDRLFLIDPRPYQAIYDQAKAEHHRVEVQLSRLDKDFARAEQLLPKKTISKEEYDKVASDRAAAAAELKAREAALEQARLDLFFCQIKAPITGRISRTLVTVGNLVTANTTHLTTIVSLDPIYAYFDVDEPTVLRIRKAIREGKLESARSAKIPVYLGLDIDENYPYKGVIDFVENRIDPKTGTLKLRGVFANADTALSPGLHAKIKLPMGQPYKALAISERAIGTSQGQKYVFVVDDKNVVDERPVTLGHQQGKLRIVTEGLKPTDRVIVDGLQRVRKNMTVDAREEKSAMPEPASAAEPVKSARANTPGDAGHGSVLH